MNERRSAEYTLRMCALDSFYLLVYLFTHNLSVSLFLSRMFSVSCLLPCFPNSICSHIYVKKDKRRRLSRAHNRSYQVTESCRTDDLM